MRKSYVFAAILSIFLFIAFLTLVLARTARYTSEAPFVSIWGQFEPKNRHSGWLVLKYESGLKNLPCRPDSDGIDSCGIAQIHLDGTWPDLERKSGIHGTYMDPITAARMLNWAMDHGELGRWTAAQKLHLVP